MITGQAVAVSSSKQHTFSKLNKPSITLLKGLGVEGDAHCGEKVQQRYQKRKNPDAPNLRQVHLISKEWIAELKKKGFHVDEGSMGENITTSGVELIALPKNTLLEFKSGAVLMVTGLRQPCVLLNKFEQGLKQANLQRDSEGKLAIKIGIMAVVVEGGPVHTGDSFDVVLPPLPHVPLTPV